MKFASKNLKGYCTMKKAFLLSLIVLNFSNNISAGFGESVSAFVGAFFGALMSSNTENASKPKPVKLIKCACGEDRHRELIRLSCCGAMLCKSCLRSRRHTALIKNESPKCHKCGTLFDYIVAEQQAALQPAPSAPVLNPEEYHINKCASGCNSVGGVNIGCKGGHHMCTSCLRSRVAKAKKEARGDQPYVTCPKCGDMLTADGIGSYL